MRGATSSATKSGWPPLILILLVMSPLSGCMTHGASCTANVPAIRVGDEFRFGLVGKFLGLDLAPRYDPGRGSERDQVVGETLKISIQQETVPALNYTRDRAPAAKATYAVMNGSSQDVFRLEEIGMADGILRSVTHPKSIHVGEKWLQQEHFGWVNLPPLLGFTMFSNEEVGPGWSKNWTFPWFISFPRTENRITWNWLDVRFIESHSANGVCEVIVDGTLVLSPGRGVTERSDVRFHLHDGAPVPTLASRIYNGSRPTMELHLAGWTPGKGRPLPQDVSANRSPTRTIASSGRAAAVVDGFLRVGENPFPTSYQEALAAIRESPQSRDWIANHPGAGLTKLHHANGAPGAVMVDLWSMDWYDAESNQSRQTVVIKERPIPLLPDHTEKTVGFNEIETGHTRVLKSSALSLDDLNNLSMALGQGRIEYLQCQFYQDYCDFGTHAATGSPYAGQSGFSRGGIVAWLERGLLLQATSFAGS